MPAQMQAVAVGPGPAGEAPVGGDLAMAEGQRLLAGNALPDLRVGVGALGKPYVIAPTGDQL